jgi:DNA-binding HxlR family transcriptional regulator
MRSYGQYCPIAEVFAQRWTPIIVRNLYLGCTHFGDILDGAPGLPRSVLADRLRTLERDGVVERDGRTLDAVRADRDGPRTERRVSRPRGLGRPVA